MKIRLVVFKILSFFGIKRNRIIIPVIPIDVLFSSLDVDPLEKEETNGNITLKELTIISQIVKDNSPKNIFEIGTFNGRTTLNLAHFSPQDSKVYTLDLPKTDIETAKFGIEEGDRKYVDKNIIGERYQKNTDKITQLYGDSATFDFSPYYGKMDFVFVDGAHSAPYVANDTEIAFKLLRKGGIILWHDYGVWRGVIKVLNNYYRKDVRFKNVKHIEESSIVYYKDN